MIGGLLVARRFIRNPRPMIALILNVTLLTIMSVTILPFFLAVGPVVVANKRGTVDRHIVSIDRALLGWYVFERDLRSAVPREIRNWRYRRERWLSPRAPSLIASSFASSHVLAFALRG